MESFGQFDAEDHPSAPATAGSVRDKLKKVGLRPTLQRLDLGQVIFGRGHRHFTAEMLFEETRALRYPPSLATIYNTLGQFAKCGLLREIAVYDAKLWYDTRTGPHFHYYREDTDELFDIPKHLVPELNIPAPPGARIETIDIIVRLTRA